ncbi:MAG: bifunctional phosphopantothenoylcysteine decarboxylase/phosphopantothenate--cysteine ligase CoaBC [Bacteroidales bacterium]
MRIRGKKIILAITGSIAAYKAAVLSRLLIKEGAELQVLMTDAGKKFISPVTLAAISGKPVESEFFANDNGEWHSHVEMGQWADLMLIAPATATTISKMAMGLADNLIIATYLTNTAPVVLCPAMEPHMYAHPSTISNITTLKNHGVEIIEPAEGEMVSGVIGKGRMQEPEHIVDRICCLLCAPQRLEGKCFVVNAGATVEKIDPVRFISNFSSGQMGCEIADALANEGATVTLVLGKASFKPKSDKIKIIDVLSADEMREATMTSFENACGAIFTAAVADYKSKHIAKSKIKRDDSVLSIELCPNPDIAAELGKIKADKLLIGFALETSKGIEEAKNKLQKKNLDLIVLNSLQNKDAGFDKNTNRVTFIDSNSNIVEFDTKTKAEVAKDIVEYVCNVFSRPTINGS